MLDIDVQISKHLEPAIVSLFLEDGRRLSRAALRHRDALLGLIFTCLVMMKFAGVDGKVLGELGLPHRGQQFVAYVIVFNRLKFALRLVELLQVARLKIIHLLLLLLELLICLGELSCRGEQALRSGDHALVLFVTIVVILTFVALNKAERGLLRCDWLLASVERAALSLDSAQAADSVLLLLATG